MAVSFTLCWDLMIIRIHAHNIFTSWPANCDGSEEKFLSPTIMTRRLLLREHHQLSTHPKSGCHGQGVVTCKPLELS